MGRIIAKKRQLLDKKMKRGREAEIITKNWQIVKLIRDRRLKDGGEAKKGQNELQITEN